MGMNIYLTPHQIDEWEDNYYKTEFEGSLGDFISRHAAENAVRVLDENGQHEPDWKAIAGTLAEALRDMHSGWKYLRSSPCNLYGLGWNRCDDSATAALAKYEQEKGV
jgi:hypothetical protein